MTISWAEAGRLVRERASDRCEYCGMHQCLQGTTFHVDHIIPRSLGGTSVLENLAWICPGCNLHKSDRIAVIDPETMQVVPLFHPRTQPWNDHFTWNGYQVAAKTGSGRATIAALDLNHPRRIRIRLAEEKFGLYPPVRP